MSACPCTRYRMSWECDCDGPIPAEARRAAEAGERAVAAIVAKVPYSRVIDTRTPMQRRLAQPRSTR